MEYINLDDYEKIGKENRKTYGMAVGGIEFESFRHKKTGELKTVKRNTNQVLQFSDTTDSFKQKDKKPKVISFIPDLPNK